MALSVERANFFGPWARTSSAAAASRIADVKARFMDACLLPLKPVYLVGQTIVFRRLSAGLCQRAGHRPASPAIAACIRFNNSVFMAGNYRHNRKGRARIASQAISLSVICPFVCPFVMAKSGGNGRFPVVATPFRSLSPVAMWRRLSAS